MIRHVRPLLGAGIALVVVLLPSASGSFGAVTATAGLAFVKDVGNDTAQVWAAAADGSGARKLGGGDQPVLSPDGTMVAAEGNGVGPALVIFKVGGGTVRLASVFAKGDYTPLAWSPDSKYVVVAKNQFLQGRQAIDVIDVATGRRTVDATGMPLGASFEPGSNDTLVYGIAHSTRENLYEVPADGSRAARAVTHNNRSAYPVWGSKGIAFDLVTSRKDGDAPTYQIALLRGAAITQITHSHPNVLVEGLQPIAVAANGVDLVADYVGQDTDFAYTVNLSTRKVTRLTVGTQVNTAYGISRDGARVLVCIDGFQHTVTHATNIATMPFGGGTRTVLVSDATEPSWNQ